jgi:tight adherence protein B
VSMRVLWGVVAALLASTGAYLLYTSAVYGWRGIGPRVTGHRTARNRSARVWLTQAGLGEVRTEEFAGAVGVLAVVGGLAAFALFGGWGAALVGAVLAAAVPVSWYRGRRQRRLAAASEAWPRLLEELRLLTGAAGRSIPQALFEVGRRAPEEWRPAFAAAEREWLLTTDFAATTALLKERLADPTADVVCETLLVAHEVGGSSLDGRLEELIEDRRADVQGRKDASSRLAGVRFARRFVLLVPLGMTLAGLSIGAGRQAYETAGGQVAVAVGLIAVAVCWVWSGRLMRLPDQPRVFR